jgi:hypothetical protein
MEDRPREAVFLFALILLQRVSTLSRGAIPAFLKLDSDLHRTAPNYPTGSESSCTVEGQIKCAWNGRRTHHYEASSKYGDVLHNAIGGASVSK